MDDYEATSAAEAEVSSDKCFFENGDWFCFAATTAVSFFIYLRTLAPDVGLDFSGIFSTGAMYAGVPHPPGYPLWTIYGWLFTNALPIGGIAWRLGVSSAFAAAITCGVIALLVSRTGKMFCRNSVHREGKWIRAVSGYVAGMIFGFNGAFWKKALVPDPWPLSMLCYSVVICLFIRWLYRPTQFIYLCAASFIYGLTITNSQMALAAAPAILFILLIGNVGIGRDILLSGSIVFVVSLFWQTRDWFRYGCYESAGVTAFHLYVFFGLVAIAVAIVMVIKTRRVFTEWKRALAIFLMFGAGLTLYLYVPVASMTNPPMNWGYARTPEGFRHTVSRGQYESVSATSSTTKLIEQLKLYGGLTGQEFGSIYLIFAIFPFIGWRNVPAIERKIIVCLLALYLSSTLLTLLVLNPDAHGIRANKTFFSASYLALAMMAGCGFTIIATKVSRRR